MIGADPTSGATPAWIDEILRSLERGDRINRKLPTGGSIHLDRRLPFLCVHRRPAGDGPTGLDSFVRAESSYLIADADGRGPREIALLVRRIAGAMRERFGSFLVLEVWSSDEFEAEPDLGEYQPRFKIAAPRRQALHSTVKELESALGAIRVKRVSAQVHVSLGARAYPPGVPPLIPSRELGRTAWTIGLAMRPIHWSREQELKYPLVRRALHRGLSRALKKGAFAFSRSHTNLRLPHFHSLGRRSMVKVVWEVDRRLAELSASFDPLLLVTPTNAASAWRKFQRSHYEHSPRFEYRALPFDPTLAKRQLFEIPVERIGDPTLELMFRDQMATLDRQIGMLGMRGTDAFRHASLELYGDVGKDLLEQAERILARIPPGSREPHRGDRLDAEAFAARAREEIEQYRAFHPELTSEVVVRSDIVGLLVSQGNLFVSADSRIPAARVQALLSHEVGTHVLTHVNGRAQPFRQLHVGLPGYDELQEGIAVLSEHLVGGLTRPRLRLLAARVVAVQRMAAGASFIDVFRELVDRHGFTRQTSFTITMRVFRSGGLAKDAVYLKGLLDVMEYLRGGGAIDPLFVGKIAVDHIPIIEELQWRKVLKPAPLRPRYLENQAALRRLQLVRAGLAVEDLVKEEPA